MEPLFDGILRTVWYFFGPHLRCTTLNYLLQMADAGDLQGAVSMYIVLGQERVKGLMLESDTVLAWFYGYIDLLQRFRLYNIATCVRDICSLTYYVHRTKSHKKGVLNCRE